MALSVVSPEAHLQRLRQTTDGILEAKARGGEAPLWHEASLSDVRRVLFILSSSRSGSSLLFSVLRQLPFFYSLSGEDTPFLRLNGFSSDAFASDAVVGGRWKALDALGGLARDFLSDFSVTEEASLSDTKVWQEDYADDLLLRFCLQWPQVIFVPEVFRGCVFQALGAFQEATGGFPTGPFYLELLSLLMEEYPQVHPYYYDIPEQRLRERFPRLSLPEGPPNAVLMIEEPPFVLLAPRRHIRKRDLREKILLMKSPADCHRMGAVKKLFPNADIKVIHLTRNPLASINGLYDGWCYRGFFSRNLKFLSRDAYSCFDGLKIRGYSDVYSWGRWWWKYDLPAGWLAYADKTLEEVCAFQWRAAHEAIFDFLEEERPEALRVVHEEMAQGGAAMGKTIASIATFLDRSDFPVDQPAYIGAPPVIQATQPPRPYRWKERAGLLLPLLEEPALKAVSQRLGYDLSQNSQWP